VNSDQYQLSIIVPVQNESGNVIPLHGEILQAARKTGLKFEIIFVDDGSTDNTLTELKQLRPVKIVVLEKKYGQSCALDLGIKNARGEVLVTLDGDGQNDPAAIPSLLEKLNKGYDAVCGWRVKRMDSYGKRFIAWGAALLGAALVQSGVHDSGCTLRAYRRQCFEGMDLHGGLHRMIPGLLKWRGLKITELQVSHRRRLLGTTKHNWTRIMVGFRDMVYIWFLRNNLLAYPKSFKSCMIKEIYEHAA